MIPEANGGGYYFIPQVVSIDDENNVAVTKIDEIRSNNGKEYTYRQFFYYDKF